MATDSSTCFFGSSNRRAPILVVGGGFLGKKIAAWLVLLGENVDLCDWKMDPVALEQAVRRMKGEVQRAHQLPPTALPYEGRLRVARDVLDLVTPSTELLIEAVQEQPEKKAPIFRAVRQVSPVCVLTTSSMSLSLLEVNRAAGFEGLLERGLEDDAVARLRFLDPVFFIPYVEYEGPGRSPYPCGVLRDFLQRHGLISFTRETLQQRIRLDPEGAEKAQRVFVQRHLLKREDVFQKTETCICCMSAEPTVLSVGSCTHICMCAPCAQRAVQVMGARAHACPMCREAAYPAVISSEIPLPLGIEDSFASMEDVVFDSSDERKQMEP